MFPLYCSNEVNLLAHADPRQEHHVKLVFLDSSSSGRIQAEVKEHGIEFVYFVRVLWVKQPLEQKVLFEHMERYANRIARFLGNEISFSTAKSYHGLVKAKIIIAPQKSEA